jgi:predicted protein tyrosine phosphatase
MTKKIIVLSRWKFEQFVKSLTPNQISQTAFISIRDIEHPIILDSASNVLNLSFDDTEEQIQDKFTLFDEQMADEIVNFVHNNEDKNLFVIHCLMGISRSGAVGEVLSDYFKSPYERFKQTNPQVIPNVLVKRILTNKIFLL